MNPYSTSSENLIRIAAVIITQGVDPVGVCLVWTLVKQEHTVTPELVLRARL